MSEGSSRDTSERQESARLRHDLNRALEERNQALKKLHASMARNERGKGSKTLEQRLAVIREELDRRNRENTRLLNMARGQAERLASIEPLPELFLGQVEEVVRLAEGDERDVTSSASPATSETLIGRFGNMMERLHALLDQNHVLENQGLRQSLTQVQSALAAKREEILSLRVEQERLAQSLVMAEDFLRQSKQEITAREARIEGLQQRLRELEVENQRLLTSERISEPRVREWRKAVDTGMFTFIASNKGLRAPLRHWSQGLRPVPLMIGTVLGSMLTLGGVWMTGYRFENLPGRTNTSTTSQALAHTVASPFAMASRQGDTKGTNPRRTPFHKGSIRTHRDTLQSGGLGPELVQLTGGTFLMGTNRYEAPPIERPTHRVKVSRFSIARYEVTFEQYDAFAQATGRAFPNDQGWGRDRRPVINVTWNDAQAYTEWLSSQTGQRYRLPTEAEWEYAIAGGRQEIFWWGTAFKRGQEICFDCGTRWDGHRSAPVGSAAPNPLGLYDMGGNVMEWVEDCAKDPDTAALVVNCDLRMVRGGAFNKPADTLHTTARRALAARDRFPMVGFRVVRAW